MGLTARKPPQSSGNGYRPGGITTRKPPARKRGLTEQRREANREANADLPLTPSANREHEWDYRHDGTCRHVPKSLPSRAVIVEKRDTHELLQFDCCPECATYIKKDLLRHAPSTWTVTVRVLCVQQQSLFEEVDA